jgi:hypothetical protein|tara:strand:- start:218 stop:466 length:249 start_codon:yes stop_codon:yes gene_type:complete
MSTKGQQDMYAIGSPSYLVWLEGSKQKKKKKVAKKQGYKDRKDESIAMRVEKKRTPAQLKASADESYGKFGSAAKKRGKINV